MALCVCAYQRIPKLLYNPFQVAQVAQQILNTDVRIADDEN